MGKVIEFNYGSKTYKLEYNREAVKMLSKLGVFSDEAKKDPIGVTINLFKYAFYMHHKGVMQKEDEILDLLYLFENKDKLQEQLMNMVSETVEDLLGEPEGKNKITWTVVE